MHNTSNMEILQRRTFPLLRLIERILGNWLPYPLSYKYIENRCNVVKAKAVPKRRGSATSRRWCWRRWRAVETYNSCYFGVFDGLVNAIDRFWCYNVCGCSMRCVPFCCWMVLLLTILLDFVRLFGTCDFTAWKVLLLLWQFRISDLVVTVLCMTSVFAGGCIGLSIVVVCSNSRRGWVGTCYVFLSSSLWASLALLWRSFFFFSVVLFSLFTWSMTASLFYLCCRWHVTAWARRMLCEVGLSEVLVLMFLRIYPDQPYRWSSQSCPLRLSRLTRPGRLPGAFQFLPRQCLCVKLLRRCCLFVYSSWCSWNAFSRLYRYGFLQSLKRHVFNTFLYICRGISLQLLLFCLTKSSWLFFVMVW